MISKNELDQWIETLMDHLTKIQSANGSFETFYLQPYYYPDNAWMKYPGDVVYITSQTLLPLTKIQSEISETIIKKSIPFLISSSLDKKIWTFAPISNKYLIPYDTDSTSLTSLILTSQGRSVSNKKFLNSLINKQNHYPFYIQKSFSIDISLTTQIKLFIHNFKMRNSENITKNIMQFTDFEFGSSCINLLYLGRNTGNIKVWKKIESEFNDFNIQTLYYMDLFHSFYFFARLISETENHGVKLKNEIISKYIDTLNLELIRKPSNLNKLLMINAILYLNHNLGNHLNLIESCFKSLKINKFEKLEPFFSSNKNTDYQPNTNKPNTYFGSPALTCSLYLEFLNLYRKRVFGKYYGEE